ncbi:hypothetical protein GOBAR_AA07506 [Gossypium barbadense]|uniref:U1 small nuclear ribonucleoprotein 70 kDa n=1 Tax=Gossypium barbadense TaxID=3634 RepID=A0A2P5YC14_GOSBA|nr:hypothetical protein GOBAR_AA07506 [Gossypium barbadense]
MGDYNDAFMRNQNAAAAVQARVKPPQNRANIQQLKLIGQSHPTGLTANLLKLFEPRPPLEFKPPPEKRKCPSYTGMAQFVSHFAEPGDPEYAPPVQEAETPAQRRARIHKLRLEKGLEKAAEELKNYDPNNDPNVSGDPYKTLFVARLNYETSESRIKREFESYGPIKRVGILSTLMRVWFCSTIKKHPIKGIPGKGLIMLFLIPQYFYNPIPKMLLYSCKAKLKSYVEQSNCALCLFAFIFEHQKAIKNISAVEKVRLVTDKSTNKPRGYAFIEYMHTRDMKAAYKQADGRKIDGRRVLVDVERGRTVPNWRPRRLGGGLGTTRIGGEDVTQREQIQSGPSRSEEPRIREDRHGDRDREKSRERGREREREREKSRIGIGNLIMTVSSPNMGEIGTVRGIMIMHDHGHRRSDLDDQHYEYYDHHRGRGEYDLDAHGDRYDQYSDRDRDRYDGMEEDDYR